MYYSITYIRIDKEQVCSNVIDYTWESLPAVDSLQKIIKTKRIFVKQSRRHLFDKH